MVFIDKANKDGQVVLIDASKLGEKIKIDNNQKTVLRDFEIEQIVSTFKQKTELDDFSKVVTFDDIKQKKYSLSAGQYFDIKIEYVDISAEEFDTRMSEHKRKLSEMFAESHELEIMIMKQLGKLKFEEWQIKVPNLLRGSKHPTAHLLRAYYVAGSVFSYRALQP